MLASEKVDGALVEASNLTDQSEETLTFLDPACQHSSAVHQIRSASVIRCLVPLALLACASVGISRVMPLPAASQHLRVIEKNEIVSGDNTAKFFEEGMERLGAVPLDLSQQVADMKKEAKLARAQMMKWAAKVVAKNQQKLQDYDAGLSNVTDELQKVELDVVRLCHVAAKRLTSLGDELQKKLASAESEKTHQDITQEQDLMISTISFVADELQHVQGHLDHAKQEFGKLAVVSAFFSDEIGKNLKTLQSKRNSADGALALGALGTILTCHATLILTLASWGSLAPTLGLCGAAVVGEGTGAVLSKNRFTTQTLAQRLNDCRRQWDHLERKCDKLLGKAKADRKQLMKVQSTVGAERVLMNVGAISIWKSQVLPKNKNLVRRLNGVVSFYR